MEQWARMVPVIKWFFRCKISTIEADDLVQEVFMRIWISFKKGTEIKHVKSYAMWTAKNLLVDEYRKKGLRAENVSLDNDEFDIECIPDFIPMTFPNFEDQIDGEIASKILFDIPDNHAQVLYLDCYEGLTPGEIAERLKITHSHACVRLHRARKHLRKKYDKLSTRLST